MLSQLFINNIAVIEKASIDFDSGFTVLTGETGAGKSIIVDAINTVLGERISKELIRTGANSASVSALFSDIDDSIVFKLEENGISIEEDDTLLIKREIKASGKSTCKINGCPATVSMLKDIAKHLISIHGQHEGYELLTTEVHQSYIDSYGELTTLIDEYKLSYQKLREILTKLNSFNVDEGEKARQVDLYKYQIEEIEAANIQVGEQEELIKSRDTVRNLEKITFAIETAKELLQGDEEISGASSKISEAADNLEGISEVFPSVDEAAQKLREAGYLLDDAEEFLRTTSIDFNIADIDAIEARLDYLYKLGLKYGDDEEKVLEFLDRITAKLHDIEFSDEEREKLEEEYEAEKKVAVSLAKELSKKREQFSGEFSNRVKEELSFLNMSGVDFAVEQERVPLNNTGCDKIQFLVSTNKGEPLKPLSKIASGGEISRIMLAIKTVLAGKDKIETLIFDEVDAGISGEAANKVGLKLKEVSKDRQVICITHLAQIAALANNHMLISKHSDDKKTYTEVSPLDFEGRKVELSRIIGGYGITELKLKMAEEMLEGSK